LPKPFAQAAIAAHPVLNIVINNAGVTLMGIFDEPLRRASCRMRTGRSKIRSPSYLPTS
jgi:hypothetical protein